MVVTNGQPFLQGNHSLTSAPVPFSNSQNGRKRWFVWGNGGTVASEQALKRITAKRTIRFQYIVTAMHSDGTVQVLRQCGVVWSRCRLLHCVIAGRWVRRGHVTTGSCRYSRQKSMQLDFGCSRASSQTLYPTDHYYHYLSTRELGSVKHSARGIIGRDKTRFKRLTK